MKEETVLNFYVDANSKKRSTHMEDLFRKYAEKNGLSHDGRKQKPHEDTALVFNPKLDDSTGNHEL